MTGDAAHWQIRLVDFGSGRLLDADQLQRLGITSFGMSPADEADAASARGTIL